ncbi:MAG: M50 family metallopeptidase [Chthonomonadales bacterium]
MADVIKGIASLIVILSVLVIVHEWGHFIVAKLCGMRVEDFSLFFGKVLVRLGVRNGTAYHIRAIPLGGFVRIAGMEPEDMAGGRNILEAIRSLPLHDRDEVLRRLKRLDAETMAGLDATRVSAHVLEVLQGAVTADGRLTEEGAADLRALQSSPQITADDQRLIQLVLHANLRSSDPALYSQKPLWQRALVIFAGPFMSLFFGYLLFCVMGMTIGLPSINKPLTNQITVSQDASVPARRAGLLTGDRIVAINGVPTPNGKLLVDRIHHSIGVPLDLTIDRSGRLFHVTVTPRADVVKMRGKDGKITTERIGRIGIMLNPVYERTGPIESIKAGTFYTFAYVAQLLGLLVEGHARDAVGGPILMGQMATAAQRLGFAHLFELAATFSLSLGIMNLLPIPILDGGHLLLLLIEKVRRRKLSAREVYKAQMVGLGILALLVSFVMYNDVVRTVAGKAIQ